jgi:tripartite-type tricarboxylate transporter receptor subunit TctC
MKHLIVTFFLLFSMSTFAKTIVPVIWPFSNASTNATMLRAIIDEANNQQQNYVFVFDHKPGAGGAVAVHHALSLNRPSILAHSSSFFIRPYLVQEGSYDVNQFNMLNVHCIGQPLAVISIKYKNINDIPVQSNVTVGMLPGSITQLVSSNVRTVKDVEVIEVPFRGTPEITASILGGHIDMGVEFLSGLSNPHLGVIGITGKTNHNNYKTFNSQQIFNFDDMVVDFFMLTHKNIDPSTAGDLNSIMSRAVNSVKHKAYCQADFGRPANLTDKDAAAYFKKTHSFWKTTAEKAIK